MVESNAADKISMFERAAYKYNPFKSSSNVPLLNKMQQLNYNNLTKQGILYVEKGYLCFNEIRTLSGVKYMAYIRYKPYIRQGYVILERLNRPQIKLIKFKVIDEL